MMINRRPKGGRLQIECETAAKPLASERRKEEKQTWEVLRRAQAGREYEQVGPSCGATFGER
jgi:hypothetical protein